MKTRTIEEIVSFAEFRFRGKRGRDMVNNLKELIIYLNSSKIYEIDLETAGTLLSKSPKLNELMGFVIKSNDKSLFIDNEMIYTLVFSYCNSHNIEFNFDQNGETIEEESTSENKKSKDESLPLEFRKNDLDLLKLYTSELNNSRPYTSEEEVEIFKKYREATGKRKEEIKNEIVVHNLRLVVKLARRHYGKNVPLGDLIQEGNLGLMKAVDRFDETLGFKFSTYATYWINQSITRYIAEQSRVVRIPVHGVEYLNKILNIKRDYYKIHGEEPDDFYIARELNIGVERLNELLMMSETISLNEKINTEDGKEDSELEDFIVDRQQEDSVFGDSIIRKDFRDAVLNSPYINDREKTILIYKFGLNGDECLTLEEIGEKYNLTRERIRQIEAKALRKLRIDPRVKAFHSDL